MKKIMVLLLIMLNFSSLFSQTKLRNGLNKVPLKWSRWEVDMTKEEKLATVESLSKIVQIEFGLKYYNYTHVNILYMYHIIDFNKDGKPDVIYNGFTGESNNGIIFFENKGNEYKKTITLYGDIIEISESDNWAPLSFKVLNYRCCNNYVNFVETYAPVLQYGTDLQYEVSVRLAYVFGQHLSQFFDAKQPLVIIQKDAPISAFPKNDTTKYDFAYKDQPVVDSIPKRKYFNYKGNVLALADSGSTGYILDKEVIDGDFWYLIKFSPDNTSQSVFCGVGDNNSYKYYIIGWINEHMVKPGKEIY